jgi:putative glycosyltransferase (TIGR04372 family)
MTETDWYVCLHMRDSGHRGGASDSGEAIRNTAMGSYLEAVRLITDAGGWVIRMGGPKTPKFPRMERVIDYAHCNDVRSPEMDIQLVRHARMFIGTTSGFAYVASAMGTPSAMVNSISSLGLLWSKNTRFTLKPIYTADGRMLSLSEMTSDAYRWAYPTHEALGRAGLTVRENTPDEIAEATREVLDLATGRVRDDDFDDAWRDHVMTKDFFASSRPSKYFLDKYPVLLKG